MGNVNACVSREIRLIQRENMRDSMHLHSCCKSSIMGLYAANAVARDQLPPGPVNLFIVREQSHDEFDSLDTRIRFLDGQAETVMSGRSSTHIPKFADVLSGVAKLCSTLCEGINGGLDNTVIGSSCFENLRRMLVSMR